MRNRGGYKNYRGGGGGGYKGYNRGGKFNNYNKRRRSSFDRDDYQNEEPEAPFESSGAPLGNFKIVLGGGDNRVIAGEGEDVPSIQSRLGPIAKLRTRVHSSEENDSSEEALPKTISSRIVRPPEDPKETSEASKSGSKSNRVITVGKDEETTSRKSSKEEKKVNGSSKIGPNHSRSARISSRRSSKSPESKKRRSATPKRRRSRSISPKVSKRSPTKTSNENRPTEMKEPTENQTAKSRPLVLDNPQLTQIDIDELVELNFDFFKKRLKKIVNQRDRLGRTPLMIILDFTAVKANVKSFEESQFKHVTKATRELINAGADLRVKDIFGDTLMQYLARWRFGKESFKSKSEQHLPRRMREILKELPLKETGRGALSIANLKDADGRAFYHNLFWSNFRDQSQVEVDRLASAFEIIAGSLKLSDEDWEIEDGEGNTLADTLLESELFSKAAYRAMKEKSGRVEIKPVERAPDKFGENPFKPKKKQSPRQSIQEEQRPKRRDSPSPVRRKRSSESDNQSRQKSVERPPPRKQQQEVAYYSDSDHADEMDIHANADDFIDDVIQMIPQKKKNRTTSRRSETPKRKRSRSRSKSKRVDQGRNGRREPETRSSRRTRRKSPTPIQEEQPRRSDSRTGMTRNRRNSDAHRSPVRRTSNDESRTRRRTHHSPEAVHRNESRGRRESPQRRRPSRHVSKSPERKRPMHAEDRRHRDRGSPVRVIDSRSHRRRGDMSLKRSRDRNQRRSISNSPPRNFELAGSRHSPLIDDRRRYSPERRGSPERRSRRESKDQLLRLANY
ncbi:Oidioi.mRNA.OKI2018_I69.chr2.g7491.t1.cds [Oikopleura dioica]|uniref:Oidioi.mRNA.OKI2018_I69.chr2.g7491.t1.cds n=1 Tax=Oikopleura dioica TaxID=34765 RepID=A0ABN7TB45_OIKDI|nr:Oidioi.mRNA.OKI2018_I69.chr2.g7491.t1.cds [Oikopleura dioica]